MSYFCKLVKSFIKMPQVLLAFCVLLCVSNIHMCRIYSAFISEYHDLGSKATDSLNFFGDIRYICIVFFVCWFFISFEFTRKLHDSSVNEVFLTMGKRSVIPYVHQIMILFLFVFIFGMNISVYGILAYLKLECPPQVFVQMIKVLFFDVILLSMASIGMGALVANIRKRFAGYIVFLLLIVLMVPDYYQVVRNVLPAGSKVLEKVHSILCFLPQDVTYTYDALYGLPFENYRIVAMLFWIVVGVASFIKVCFAKERRTKVTIVGGYCVVALLFLIMVLNKGSVLRMDDVLWYVFSYYDEHEGMEQSVNYSVSKYQIDFKIRNDLSAVCKVDLTGEINQTEYIFTLYHGYKLGQVQDGQGENLTFSQEGDYIRIYSDKPVKQLVLSYSGCGDMFYSNENACFLPGFFPYYPRAGFVTFFDSNNMTFREIPKNQTEFDIGIDYSPKFTTNLPKVGGRYQGKTEDIIIVSGNYEERNDKSVRYVVLPMQKSSYQMAEELQNGNVQKRLEKLLEYLGGEKTDSFSQNLMITIPNSTVFITLLDGFYSTDSYLLFREQCMEYNILKNRVGQGSTGYLKQIFFELEPGEEFNIKDQEYRKDYIAKEKYTKSDELYDTVLVKMQEVGVQEVAKEIYRYITSDHYHENIEENLSYVQAIK